MTEPSPALLVAVIAGDLEERAVHIATEEGAPKPSLHEGFGIGFPEHMRFFGVTYQGLESVCIWKTDPARAERIARRLNLELDLLQPYNGLAFTLEASDDTEALLDMAGARPQAPASPGHEPPPPAAGLPLSLLAVMFPDADRDAAVEIVRRGGGAGLTLMDARNATTDHHPRILSLHYEGARTLLLAILETGHAERLRNTLNNELGLAARGRGLGLVLPLRGVAGLKPEQIERLLEDGDR